MDEIRFAIVGCGVIAPTHTLCLAELPDARLVAVCDIIEEKAHQLASTYFCDAYANYVEMVQRDDIDVVLVLTPSGLHAQVGIAAARAGKHVVVEKPIDVTLEKADALIDACRQAGVSLSVISQHRFDPAIVALKQAVKEGRLGQLNFGSAQTKWYRTQEYYDSAGWRGTWELDGGGALMNQSVHYVDLLTYIMGPVEELHGYCALRAHERIAVEDVAVASLRFASGALGFLEGSTLAYPGFFTRLDVHGSLATVIVENDKVKEWVFRSGEICPVPAEPSGFIGGSSSQNIWHHAHKRQLADIIEAIRSQRPPLVTGEEGRRALQIVLAVYESARSGQPVRL